MEVKTLADQTLGNQIYTVCIRDIRNYYRELKHIDVRLMADATFDEMGDIEQKVASADSLVTSFEEELAKINGDGQPVIDISISDRSVLMNLKETIRCLRISMGWTWREQYRIKKRHEQLSA